MRMGRMIRFVNANKGASTEVFRREYRVDLLHAKFDPTFVERSEMAYIR